MQNSPRTASKRANMYQLPVFANLHAHPITQPGREHLFTMIIETTMYDTIAEEYIAGYVSIDESSQYH